MPLDLVARLSLNSSAFTSGMRSAERQMNGMRSTVGSVVKSMGLITGAFGVAKVAMDSTKKAMDFQEQMSSIQALTGMSNRQLGQMSRLALQAGAKTSWSATESAKAIEELAKAGMSTATIKAGGLTSALNLATAGGMNLADSANLLSNALNGFRHDSLTASKAADILAGAANASSADMIDLKFGLAAVGSVSSGIGMSLKDTSAALALFSNNSLQGSDAGTSFKTMLSNLKPKTDAAYGAMQKLGIITKNGKDQFFDTKGNVKSLSNVAGILQNSLKGLTAEQRQTTLYTMFGSDAIRAANILYDEGANGVKKMYGEMGKVTALQVARQKMNNAKGSVEQFRGALETLQISVLTPLLPTIKAGANALANWVTKIKPAQIQQWGNNIKAAGQKALNIAIFIKQHWSGISSIILAVAAATITFKTAMMGLMIIKTVTRMVYGLRVAYGLMTGAQWALNVAMDANPIGAVILAISALIGVGVLLYRNWDKVKATAISVGHGISAAWGRTKATVSSFFSDMWSAAKTKFGQIIDAAKHIPEGIGSGLKHAAGSALDGITSVAHSLVNKFKSILGIHSPSRVFAEMGGHIVQGLVNGLSTQNLKSFGESVLRDFGGGALKGWNAVKGFFSGLLSGGVSGNITGWLTAALAATGTSLSWLPGMQKLVGAESGGNAKAVNSTAVSGQHATGLLQMLPSTFSSYAMSGFGSILNPLHNAIASIRYIKDRYGSVYNTPLFSGGSYKGYNGGLNRVPYDGFKARLHKDERVLTRNEADSYRSGNSSNQYTFNVTFTGSGYAKKDADQLFDYFVKKIELAGEAGA